MISAPFWIVDVFTERAFGGNPLCVVAPHEPLAVPIMQGLAFEMGFSETVFIHPNKVASDRYSARIFTPSQELGFAGHPSLGAALVFDLMAEAKGSAGERRYSQETSAKVTEMTVLKDADLVNVRLDQGVAEFSPYLSEAETSRALSGVGVDQSVFAYENGARVVSTGLSSLMYPVADAAGLSALRPEMISSELLSQVGAQTLYAFTTEVPGEYITRCFAGPVGVPEDPATGSAAGALGAHLLERKPDDDGLEILISQGQWMDRPSRIRVMSARRDDSVSAVIEGGCVVVGQGEFSL